jgi:hypothetical protein
MGISRFTRCSIRFNGAVRGTRRNGLVPTPTTRTRRVPIYPSGFTLSSMNSETTSSTATRFVIAIREMAGRAAAHYQTHKTTARRFHGAPLADTGERHVNGPACVDQVSIFMTGQQGCRGRFTLESGRRGRRPWRPMGQNQTQESRPSAGNSSISDGSPS